LSLSIIAHALRAGGIHHFLVGLVPTVSGRFCGSVSAVRLLLIQRCPSICRLFWNTLGAPERQAAIFLTCIGSEAYDAYRAMTFNPTTEKKKIEPIIEASDKFCIGSVNVTYERYVFNRRTQETGERFDVFLGELRRLIKSCTFGEIEDSILRDRIVVGIKDDSTRHKLLQIRDLTLQKAIDICKASVDAGRQLRAMTTSATSDEVHATFDNGRGRRSDNQTNRKYNGQRDNYVKRAASTNRKCNRCDRQHGKDRKDCPAIGKACRKCNKLNHYQTVCR
jgi:hypothetical protein